MTLLIIVAVGAPLWAPFSPWWNRNNVGGIMPPSMFVGYRKLFPALPAVAAVLLGLVIALALLCVYALVFVMLLQAR